MPNYYMGGNWRFFSNDPIFVLHVEVKKEQFTSICCRALESCWTRLTFLMASLICGSILDTVLIIRGFNEGPTRARSKHEIQNVKLKCKILG